MKCPYCENETTKVKDSRETEGKVRRRRECAECERRFTTYETAEKLDIQVTKRDGAKEPFKESKIREGIQRAVQKTAITAEEVDEAVENVKKQVMGKQELTSEEIGNTVKKELQEMDEVAYIRFASVYESFDDAESFEEEIKELKEKQG
ncbi:transcriptional regulator NrdR [Candidatus Nanohalococcus occultus]|uniref:Transcriptional repressor NrdR n=1 Tax=Candidatus Nanohalococcus occultus TaxID=2978047 RepID=A0ABY8CFR8_9ARCH|nr:Transcriptional regulator NrdR (Zn-ribbon and ATP-cone domains) [Candidatus Nanohaloarchaeota archaeon SVXNc]